VVAFEASPENARGLRDRFHATPHVDVRHAAATDASGTLELHLDARSSKRHSLYRSIVSVPGESVIVPAVKLDDLRGEVNRVDLIKIDAQGAEGRILTGARALLERDHPVILFELWPAGMVAAGTPPADLFSFLAALGYRCVRLSVKGRQKSRPSIDAFLAQPSRWASTNIIAWPPARRPTVLQRLRRRLLGD
jgi:FkbM family methyltransferase